MRKIIAGVLGGLSLTLSGGLSIQAKAEELTIFWAEWDPANYLQELVNEYERGNRRQGDGRDDNMAGFPDQGLHRVQCQR